MEPGAARSVQCILPYFPQRSTREHGIPHSLRITTATVRLLVENYEDSISLERERASADVTIRAFHSNEGVQVHLLRCPPSAVSIAYLDANRWWQLLRPQWYSLQWAASEDVAAFLHKLSTPHSPPMPRIWNQLKMQLVAVDLGYSSVRELWWARDLVSLKVARFDHCLLVHDASALAGLPQLAELSLAGCSVESVDALSACPRLCRLDVSDCHRLLRLSPTSCFRALRELVAVSAGLVRLHKMRNCPLLERVVVTGCVNLESVTALRRCPRLRTLHASRTALSHVDGLRLCPLLSEVVLEDCFALRSVSGLSGSTSLETLKASRSTVESISGLRKCTALQYACFDQCFRLQSLHSLRGAPHLLEVSAKWSGLRDVAGLAQCPKLRSVNFEGCDDITSLSALQTAPSLVEIIASRTSVADIHGLGRCRTLSTLNLNGCACLSNIEGLRGANALCALYMNECDLIDVSALTEVPTLEHLSVSDCYLLNDLRPFVNLKSLRELQACRSGISSLYDLRHCVSLEKVSLDGCEASLNLSRLESTQHLRVASFRQTLVRDIGPLWRSECLEELYLDGCRQLVFPQTPSGLPALHRLSLSMVASAVPETLFVGCPNLTVLNMEGCVGVSDADFLRLLPMLRDLNVSHTSLGVVTAAACLPRLETLDVSHCQYLRSLSPMRTCRSIKIIIATGSGVQDISGLGECPALERLELGSCVALAEIVTPLRGSRKLRSLCIPSTTFDTMSIISVLKQECPTLQCVTYSESFESQ